MLRWKLALRNEACSPLHGYLLLTTVQVSSGKQSPQRRTGRFFFKHSHSPRIKEIVVDSRRQRPAYSVITTLISPWRVLGVRGGRRASKAKKADLVLSTNRIVNLCRTEGSSFFAPRTHLSCPILQAATDSPYPPLHICRKGTIIRKY